MEKMLVTQALDERDLLVKKIGNKINSAEFVDSVKGNDTKVMACKITEQEFNDRAMASFQSINDLIDRFKRIDAAISKSNSTTVINTTFGEMTVASAISFRGRMKGNGSYDSADFERQLIYKLSRDYQDGVNTVDRQNYKLAESAEGMRLSILGKDSKAKDDKPLAVVDAYVKENETRLVDPLDAKQKASDLQEKLDGFLKEIDTLIKVSNATTLVEF